MRHARPRDSGGDFLGSGDDNNIINAHQGIAQRAFVCQVAGSEDRAMHSRNLGVPVDSQMQVRDVTKADQGLRVPPQGVEVEPACNAICALPTARRERRSAGGQDCDGMGGLKLL